jgi:hypothetical protein
MTKELKIEEIEVSHTVRSGVEETDRKFEKRSTERIHRKEGGRGTRVV